MKKALILASMAVLALVSCEKKEFAGTEKLNEMSFVAMNSGDLASRGYSTTATFEATTYETLHGGTPTKEPRTMQLSAYLYPQNGDKGNYFVGTTFAKGESDEFWHANPAIYWPVGGTMDFLAYSLHQDKNVAVAWDTENAASKVTLSVPGENSQNDILYASKFGVQSQTSATPVDMKFNHAQAWLEFVLTSNLTDVVTLKSIVLEDVYNAGELTITNNRGNAIAEWSFNEQPKDVVVDNYYSVVKLNGTSQYLDMLIPQQKKTAFVIYYTLGNDTQVLSYRFPTDLKTWLMGEKYIYNIKINTAEITVAPTVTGWNEREEDLL